MSDCSSCGAIAGGLRAQLDAGLARSVLDQAGLREPSLATAIDALEQNGRNVARAGVAALEHETLGRLIDVTA